MEKFLITKNSCKNIRRFGVTGRTLEFRLKPVPAGGDPVKWVKTAVEEVVRAGTAGLESTDQVSFSFCSKDFARGEGWMRFKPLSEISYDDVWDTIAGIYQSNSTGLNTETFCLGVTSVKMPAGKGRGRKYNTFEEECGKRRGIVTIKNKDNLCLPRALVVAMASVNKDPEYTKVRTDKGKLQRKRALELLEAAEVEIPEEGAGIPELQRFQVYLADYKISVYAYGSKGRDVIYQGSGDKNINLLYHAGHYNVITSLTAAFCCTYYCEACHVPYDHKDEHRCGGTCPACQHSPACPSDILKMNCEKCKRSFRGENCFERHRPICGKIRRCEECFKTVKSDRKHFCGEIFCKICKKHVPPQHLCYIQPDKGKPQQDVLFIFYDFETRQEKQLEDGALLHEPNLCVYQQRCDRCIEEKRLFFCQKCGYRQKILQKDVTKTFLEYVLAIRKKFKQVVVIGHNAGGFDNQFMLNHILTKTALTPELIMRGTKMILMDLQNIKFLDSLNYFPMALSKLPKAFGLNELKKGVFPHLFNTEENQNYVGPLPSVEFYDPDNMKGEDREKFLKWYESTKECVFDFQKEFIDYCVSDVEILAGACLKFRQQMLNTTNVCPFTEATTIASTCNKVYRRHFLQPNTIGIIPKNGYRMKDNQSRVATQWLVWEERRRGIDIVHSAKEQEAVVDGVKVDGFCNETKQVFEFHGCYYHGCPRCYKHQRTLPLIDDPSSTLDLRYDATVAKTEHLSRKHEVFEMWECEFREMLKDPEVYSFTESHPLVNISPLRPRDALYGGRTGNCVEYYRACGEEKIKYVDVCSLYPWVCKYGKFPVGHPRVYVGAECNALSLPTITGVISCKILPPQNLFHPVLPQKMNNKLMFVLCRSCGENMTEECTHNVEERALKGAWVVEEVVKAVEKGYVMQEIYEIWSYDSCRFDRSTGTMGLFTEMMNTFIKIKQEASGWPKDCRTAEEKDWYITEFFNREDVKLEYGAIVENPGLRCLAKLILNSLWGKFAQRENQPKTKIINDPSELFNMLSNPAHIVNTILPVSENAIVMSYEVSEEAYTGLSTINVVIASYVTALARLKLYSYLEQLENRVLYYDTDSVIYVSKPEEYDVPTGEFLGDMTDELDGYGPGSYITEFVSGGPKNYSYKVWNGLEERVVCKVKGISLNYSTSQLINFESIKKMVLEKSEPIFISSRNIRRTKEHEVVTRMEQKTYRPNSTKRNFKDGSSYPYGFKQVKRGY